MLNAKDGTSVSVLLIKNEKGVNYNIHLSLAMSGTI